MSTNFIREHIQSLTPYQPILPLTVLADELNIPVENLIKLDANENPYGTIPAVREALAILDGLHIYPDPESRFLREALAKTVNVPADQIIIGAGADELIDLLMRLTLNPGDTMLNCPPTFGVYAFDAAVNDVQIINIPRASDFSIDIDQLERAIQTQQPKLIFLANPNNPDGSLLSEENILRLLALPILVVLDEAYIEFAAKGTTWIQRVNDFENLIVLRTFSKWAGLAGLRIGYGVFPSSIREALMKIKQPYNVAVSASTAALAVLAHMPELGQQIECIITERERMLGMLTEIEWLLPYPSRANFILLKVLKHEAATLTAWLRERGILVRYFNKPGMQDHIRISVGRPEQTETVIAALKEYHNENR